MKTMVYYYYRKKKSANEQADKLRKRGMHVSITKGNYGNGLKYRLRSNNARAFY